MTRDEILAMKPGRELDALVAEKLMGWTDLSPIKPEVDHSIGVNGYRRNFGVSPYNGQITPLHHYSTDISAAWEVVEEIGGMEEWMLYRLSHSDTVDEVDLGYACEFLNVKRGFSVAYEGKTAPEAICKATLLAVLEDPNEQ